MSSTQLNLHSTFFIIDYYIFIFKIPNRNGYLAFISWLDLSKWSMRNLILSISFFPWDRVIWGHVVIFWSEIVENTNISQFYDYQVSSVRVALSIYLLLRLCWGCHWVYSSMLIAAVIKNSNSQSRCWRRKQRS